MRILTILQSYSVKLWKFASRSSAIDHHYGASPNLSPNRRELALNYLHFQWSNIISIEIILFLSDSTNSKLARIDRFSKFKIHFFCFFSRITIFAFLKKFKDLRKKEVFRLLHRDRSLITFRWSIVGPSVVEKKKVAVRLTKRCCTHVSSFPYNIVRAKLVCSRSLQAARL